MKDDVKFDVHEQMNRSRYRNGRHERLENGEWVPWPVLKIDKYARDAHARSVAREERSREERER